MPTESVRRARQREYSATYRENKTGRRSPARRDVAEVIATMVMERGKAGLERFVVKRFVNAALTGASRKRSARLCSAKP